MNHLNMDNERSQTQKTVILKKTTKIAGSRSVVVRAEFGEGTDLY